MLHLFSALKRARTDLTQARRAVLMLSVVLLLLTIGCVIAIVISGINAPPDPDGIQKAKAKLHREEGRFDPGSWDYMKRTGR